MKRIVTRTTLAGAGFLLGVIGSALILAPRDFLETSHVFMENDPGLMSELAAPAGILLITSTLMLTGAIKIRLADPALSIGAIVYGSYGTGRLISMVLHGLPSDSLVAAMAIELAAAVILAGLRFAGWSRNPRSDAEDDLRGAIV
ncbi:DUF4345 family protein [Hyphobacterium sp.]|uniref:DUF4345 family protein n=1 Tax=Hyphobacterium sp. TaxID=2004662 RepID=UPI003B528B6F